MMNFVCFSHQVHYSFVRLLSQGNSHFLGAGGAKGWPRSLPRSLTPRTRSILPRMMLLGIPLEKCLSKNIYDELAEAVFLPSSFVVIDNLRFLVDFGCKIFLAQAFALASLLNATSNACVN